MDINTIITELLFESPETAQQILNTKMPGYTIEILESGDTIIVNSHDEIVATIKHRVE